MPARKTDKTSKPGGRQPAKRTAAPGKAATPLPESMVAMGKSTRGVELRSLDDLDARHVAAWMKQVAAVSGVGGKKR